MNEKKTPDQIMNEWKTAMDKIAPRKPDIEYKGVIRYTHPEFSDGAIDSEFHNISIKCKLDKKYMVLFYEIKE